MSDLKSRFEDAAERVTRLAQRPDNKHLLELYAHYKQATEGDVSGQRPRLPDFTGMSKFDAWSRLKGMEADTAMQKYIDLVEGLEKAG